MKYLLIVAALATALSASAQTEMQRTPGGTQFQLLTHNTGDRIKVNDVLTFDFIQKTDKDSVLMSSYDSKQLAQAQCVDPKSVTDYVASNLMEILPLATVNDSLLIKFPTDSIFKGHDDQRPAFFPKGSSLVFLLKIKRVQSLADAKAEHEAELAKVQAGLSKMKTADSLNAIQYIADHKLALKTTASGLKYVITQPSVKAKPLAGDTLLVNYTGRTLDDKVFDSSVESVAKQANLNQPGRTYEPIEFVVGSGGIIPGWDEGLRLVGEGGKATLVIPPALAYGEQGAGEAIKPYSTLVFDVELVKIKPGNHDLAQKESANVSPAVKAIIARSSAGETIKMANLRSAPSSAGKLVRQLPAGAKLYVVPGKEVSGYCKVIDAETNHAGWVIKSALKVTGSAKK